MLNNSPAKDGRPSSAAGTFNSSARDRPGSGLSDPPPQPLHDHQFVSGPELPEALEKLEQKVAFVESAMEQLRHLVDLPPSELASGFLLDKFDGERTKIRAADHLGAQRLAESYLMSYRDIERRFEAQRRRMDVLEGRTARMETLFGEQIQLNKELGAEAVSALRRFVDREQRALKCWAEARATTEAHRLEKEKFKDQLGLLEEQNRQLDTQMKELTEEKLAISRKLVECQNDNHSLRMANDQLLHENQAQAKLLEIKDAQVDELLQRVQTSGSVLDEKELAIRRITMEREEMENRLAQERENFQTEQERLRVEHEKRLQEERAQLENRVQAEQLADAGRQQNSDKTVVQSLQKAAEAHRKMEQQLERVSAEKRELEQNLDAYKRRFVAELNRELTAQCSRLGNGLNSALMEVLVRLNCEHSTTAASRLASGQPGQSGVTDNEPSTAAGEFTVQASSRTAQHFHQQQQNQSKQQRQQQSQQQHNNDNNHNQHHPHPQSDSPPPPIQLDDSFNSPYSMSVPPAAAANRNADVVIAPPKTNRNRNEGGGGRRREKENVPTAAAAQKQTNTAAGAGIRKRPLVNLIGASNGCSSIEPFLVSKQVPLEILRKTKPWRPPGCDPPPPAVRKTKQQQKRPHLQQHHQQQQAQTPPTTATMQKELGIGAPIFTSTPAKKRIFPKFQL